MTNSDLPTLDDKLGWATELDRFSERVRTCRPPHVFGIHGDWGTGKTSFMRQLQARLGGEMPDDGSVSTDDYHPDHAKQKAIQKKVATVWFDTWRFQNEPVPVVALLQEMRNQLALLPTIAARLKKAGGITTRFLLDSFSDVGKAIGIEGIPSAEKIVKTGEAWEQTHHEHTLHTNSIRQHLRETIAGLMPDKEARVVVFIDDIDRCNPKAAIRLLEGLKIYLSLPNCVFVLGMNERILVDAIREELSAPKETPDETMKLRAGHYLEKICTDLYRLPLPTKPATLLCGWVAGSEQTNALSTALGDLRCLPPNPRRLKSLANQWVRLADIMPMPQDEKQRAIWAVRVLVAAYIHQFHRELWERWHFIPDFWKEMKDWIMGQREVIPSPFHEVKESAYTGPIWAKGLQLTEKIATWDDQSRPNWESTFPNPGDIEIFWIDSLIRDNADQLVATDFLPLLKLQSIEMP